MKEVEISTPFDLKIEKIEIGCIIKISGAIYIARDFTYKKMIDEFKKKKNLPFDMKNQIIYYTSAILSTGSKVIGPCTPASLNRMEPYLQFLLSNGIKAIIGKGPISKNFINLLKKYDALYLLATAGTSAFLSKFIKSGKIVAYKELGPDALYKLEVENFPVIVAAVKGKYLLEQ